MITGQFQYLRLSGRIGRQQFLVKFLLIQVLTCGVALAGSFAHGPALLSLLPAALLTWLQVSLVSKRFHDRNLSAWWILAMVAALPVAVVLFATCATVLPGVLGVLCVVPGYAGWAFIIYFVTVLFFAKGTSGPNRFGPDPIDDEVAPPRVIDIAAIVSWSLPIAFLVCFSVHHFLTNAAGEEKVRVSDHDMYQIEGSWAWSFFISSHPTSAFITVFEEKGLSSDLLRAIDPSYPSPCLVFIGLFFVPVARRYLALGGWPTSRASFPLATQSISVSQAADSKEGDVK